MATYTRNLEDDIQTETVFTYSVPPQVASGWTVGEDSIGLEIGEGE